MHIDIAMTHKLGAVLACALIGAGIACPAIPASAASQKVPAGATYAFDGDCGICHTVETASYGDDQTAEAQDIVNTDAIKDGAKSTDASSTSDSVSSTDASNEATATDEDGCLALLKVSAHQSFECVTCHDDQDAMDSVHEDVAEGDRIPKRLKKTEVDSEVCLTCHESYEVLAEDTEDCTALTDSKGTVVNPHEVVELNDRHGESLTCFSCHEAHSDDAVADSAARSCESCHHTNVYECYTCHE